MTNDPFDPFSEIGESGRPRGSRRYFNFATELHRLIGQRAEAFGLQDALLNPSVRLTDRQRELVNSLIGDPLTPSGGTDTTRPPEGSLTIPPSGVSVRDRPISLTLIDYIDSLNDAIGVKYEQAFREDPAQAFSDFPSETPGDDLLDSLFGSRGGGRAPAPFQFQFLSNGDLVALNPNNGQATTVGNFPAAVDRQVLQNKDGDLIAINPFDPSDQIVLIEGFGFPEIDPRERFALEKAAVQAQFQGLELQKRGLEIEAIGQDFAFQIEIGRMTIEEPRQRLETITSAMEVRRREREQLLEFGVTRASLRQRDGETVTLLPGGAQLAALLSQATGQQFGPEFAELGVTFIDPEGAGQAVLDAGAFPSQIAGLQAGLAETRRLIESILGQPLATSIVGQEAADMIAEGI